MTNFTNHHACDPILFDNYGHQGQRYAERIAQADQYVLSTRVVGALPKLSPSPLAQADCR